MENVKTLFLEKEMNYDGTQLCSLYNYLEHGLLGNSILAWLGPCDVSFEHMVDGEDLLAKSEIRGSMMLHFIFEIFDQSLVTGVFLQRLMASLCLETIHEWSPSTRLRRDGDDIFWGQNKLSISIATRSPQSVLVHFAMNIRNEGTPVATCALADFEIDAKKFALTILGKMKHELQTIQIASYKVKPVKVHASQL